MYDSGLALTPKQRVRGPEADTLDSPAKRKRPNTVEADTLVSLDGPEKGKRLGWEAKKACTDGIPNTDDTKSNPVSTPAKERGQPREKNKKAATITNTEKKDAD